MDYTPATPVRLSLKRPLDASSGETPAPKRLQHDPTPMLEYESEEESMASPTATVTRKKKSAQSQPPTRKPTSKNMPKPPPPPHFHESTPQMTLSTPRAATLPEAFEHIDNGPIAPETQLEQQQPLQEVEENDDVLDENEINEVLAGFQEEWASDPSAIEIDMSKVFDTEPREMLKATAPGQKPVKREWDIIDTSPDHPDLNHQSDNPYDFLSAAKLDKLLRFWKGDEEAAMALTKAERDFLGDTKIGKMLVKVVVHGPDLDEEKKIEWFRAAITSIVAQRNPKASELAKSRLAINPAKPGYSWVVVPMRAPVFRTLERVRAALDPRSGTLVLFRPWVYMSAPMQRVYAIGIHRKDDRVPFEVASEDYAKQMEESLTTNNIRILNMKPALHGDAKYYCTEITLGFKEGTTPFLINPQRLSRHFWTGPANTKTARKIEYRWPSKCKYCESEGHLTDDCPWLNLEIGGVRPNLYDCRYHSPGWKADATKGKGRAVDTSTKIMDLRPSVAKTGKGRQSAGKGKAKAMDVDPTVPK